MFLRLLSVAAVMLLTVGALPAKDLKVLMIGNSFSICVGKHMPQIVASVPGHTLELTSCYIGGCTFDRHFGHLAQAENDPKHKAYRITKWVSGKAGSTVERGSVNEMLKNNKYDIVTIQQGSSKCWDFNFYEPFAGDLIKYIRKHQPQAQIVIQQTWSYRFDAPRFKGWNFDQQGMYDRLNKAYAELAAKYKFQVIPTGDAVQLFRARTPKKVVPADVKKFKKPAVPDHSGDVVGKYGWRKDKKSGKEYLATDYIHLNSDGEYMQALVWFAKLYNEPVCKVKYVPANMSKEMDQLLRSCAQDAVNNYKQVK